MQFFKIADMKWIPKADLIFKIGEFEEGIKFN